jgi:chromosome partitioning protein
MQVAREIAERGKAKDEVVFDSNVVSINYNNKYKDGIA